MNPIITKFDDSSYQQQSQSSSSLPTSGSSLLPTSSSSLPSSEESFLGTVADFPNSKECTTLQVAASANTIGLNFTDIQRYHGHCRDPYDRHLVKIESELDKNSTYVIASSSSDKPGKICLNQFQIDFFKFKAGSTIRVTFECNEKAKSSYNTISSINISLFKMSNNDEMSTFFKSRLNLEISKVSNRTILFPGQTVLFNHNNLILGGTVKQLQSNTLDTPSGIFDSSNPPSIALEVQGYSPIKLLDEVEIDSKPRELEKSNDKKDDKDDSAKDDPANANPQKLSSSIQSYDSLPKSYGNDYATTFNGVTILTSPSSNSCPCDKKEKHDIHLVRVSKLESQSKEDGSSIYLSARTLSSGIPGGTCCTVALREFLGVQVGTKVDVNFECNKSFKKIDSLKLSLRRAKFDFPNDSPNHYDMLDSIKRTCNQTILNNNHKVMLKYLNTPRLYIATVTQMKDIEGNEIATGFFDNRNIKNIDISIDNDQASKLNLVRG